MKLGLAIAAVAFLAQSTAFAQVRPAATKNVDEPARNPYFHTIAVTCPFTNSCYATFPAVPAGKRLRVTRIGAFARFQPNGGFLALDLTYGGIPVVAFPVSPMNLNYFGNCISADFAVDYYFEAGQTPVLELGNGAGWSTSPLPNVRITGYLVDLTM